MYTLIAEANYLTNTLTPLGSLLVPVIENLVDTVWGSDRPERPASQVLPLDIRYAGK
jgi:Xaa-Pro aminopeptidase